MDSEPDSLLGDDEVKRPKWRVNEAYTVLAGMPVQRGEERWLRDKEERYTAYASATFACGCTVSDDGGWTSCGQGLHAALAGVWWNSPFAAQCRAARAAFDAVLAEAWRRYGGPPEACYDFHVGRQAEFITFERWKEASDLLGKSIWKKGYLQADLRDVPMVDDVRLWVTHGRREIMLEWRHEGGAAARLPYSAAEAVRIVF